MTSLLHRQRIDAVLAEVRDIGAETVLDLGCGDGDFIAALTGEPRVREIVGVDSDAGAIASASRRFEAMPTGQGPRIILHARSLAERAEQLAGYDAAVLLEVIEHVDPSRLFTVEHAVFGVMRPRHVIVTTPNSEYNTLLGVPATRFRHPDHRFEWDRERFAKWAGGVSRRNGYAARLRDVPGGHPTLGGPTQMAVFERVAGTGDGPVAASGE